MNSLTELKLRISQAHISSEVYSITSYFRRKLTLVFRFGLQISNEVFNNRKQLIIGSSFYTQSPKYELAFACDGL